MMPELIDRTSRRLSILFAVTFGLTIASFLASRVISERRAGGITAAATSISDHALPSNNALAALRAELRHVAFNLDKIQHRANADPESLRMDLVRSDAAVRRSWTAYARLGGLPAEEELIGAAEADMHGLTASLDTVERLLAEGARLGASDEIDDEARPDLARVEGELQAIAVQNRKIAAGDADEITRLRATSRTWGMALDGLSALLAVVSALFVIHVVRQLWTQAATRAKELEHFAGRVAHDVRSPLTTVSFALELARRTSDDPQTASVLERGTRTLQRVGQLVDGLLVFATSGKPFTGDPGANVKEVVHGVIDDVRLDAEAKGIHIECDLPEADLSVACNPGVLVSLVSNLVVNALKYMGEGPSKRVEVRVRESAGRVRFEVADTGPGITRELRAKLFYPHVRGESVTAPGFGLGLATVRRLVEAHGGQVGVEANVGSGSIFWFELPRWKDGG